MAVLLWWQSKALTILLAGSDPLSWPVPCCCFLPLCTTNIVSQCVPVVVTYLHGVDKVPHLFTCSSGSLVWNCCLLQVDDKSEVVNYLQLICCDALVFGNSLDVLLDGYGYVDYVKAASAVWRYISGFSMDFDDSFLLNSSGITSEHEQAGRLDAW